MLPLLISLGIIGAGIVAIVTIEILQQSGHRKGYLLRKFRNERLDRLGDWAVVGVGVGLLSVAFFF